VATDNQQFKQLLDISRDLASTLDLDILLRKIMRVAVNLSNAESALVFLFDETKGGIVLQFSSNIQNSRTILGSDISSDSVAGQVAAQGKPMIVTEINQDQRPIVTADPLLPATVRSLIAVPLVAKDKVQGVLQVVNKKQGLFNDSDVDVLTVLAAQAAIAVENSRLYQQADLINELVHELRTPLASILTITYLLKRSDLTDEQRLQFTESIANEVTRLNNLASSYLEYSRLETGRLTFTASLIDLAAVLQECSRILQPKAREAGIQLTLSLPDRPLTFEGDENKIKQVVINLLNNAIKYNSPGGHVNIDAWGDGQIVGFSVQDDGIGIPEEDLPHVFEKFYRAAQIQEAYPGTGLGLSICSRIVEIHGGTIRVQSQVKAGSTFTIELPVCARDYI
jgi:signal transduction histidine kinase